MEINAQVTNDQAPVSQPVSMPYADLAAQGNEEAIAHDIACMWETHRSMQGSVKDSQKELRELGKTLGEALFFMKLLLARPGRNGKWSEFLREKKIPRTSGDRLVSAYERSVNPDANCTNGAIQSPTQDEVRKLCSAVWSRVGKKLATSESVYWFIRDFALVSGARHESREGGILVFTSPRETAEEPSTAAAPAAEEAHAGVAEEPPTETVAATPTAGPLAGNAEANSGEVI
ncbi:MAG: hypothetical protein ABSG54_18505 [Terriglobia bacterium]